MLYRRNDDLNNSFLKKSRNIINELYEATSSWEGESCLPGLKVKLSLYLTN
jgi:hypothetical protein